MIQLLGATLAWFADGMRWSGSDSVPTRLLEHIQISALCVVVATAIALPIGMLAGHTNRGAFLAVNVANLGRALPSMALLALALPIAFSLGLGLGFWPTVFALVPLGLPPILTNSYAALRGVDADVVEAARGMGMSEWQVLRRAELPLAAPLIVAGIRNAAVGIVATATLGALVAGGGLGRYIVDGLARQQPERLLAGAILVALLAVSVELVFALLEGALTPRAER